jgi:hypothetical protein
MYNFAIKNEAFFFFFYYKYSLDEACWSSKSTCKTEDYNQASHIFTLSVLIENMYFHYQTRSCV